MAAPETMLAAARREKTVVNFIFAGEGAVSTKAQYLLVWEKVDIRSSVSGQTAHKEESSAKGAFISV